jgi:drug/metabolite transporter (DMT)-like permease
VSTPTAPQPAPAAGRWAGDGATVAAFVGYSLLAGGNAVGVRFSNRELEPLWGSALRFGLAALLLLVAMAALRLPVPRGRALLGAAVYGLLNFALGFGLIYWGLLEVRAGLSQILLSLVPLVTLLLAAAWLHEPIRGVAVAGALTALAGVAVMSTGSGVAAPPLLSVLAVVGGAVCFAQALVFVRYFPRLHPVVLNAVGMGVGALALLAAATLGGEAVRLPREAPTWWALAYLVLVGSITVFLLYVLVIARWGANRAAYGFVIIPVVTVLLSAWLDDEPVTWALLLGGALVLIGVYVGALRRRATPDRSAHHS